MAAPVMNAHRMLDRHLIEIVQIELAILLYFGVVEKESFDPESCRCFLSFCAEFVDDAGERYKLDLKGIANDHLIEKNVAPGVIVTIDEPGHNRHLLGIERASAFANECPSFRCVPHIKEARALHGECLRLGHIGINRIDLSVEHHKISMMGIRVVTRHFGEHVGPEKTTSNCGGAGRCETQ